MSTNRVEIPKPKSEKEFDYSTQFLNQIRMNKEEVEVFLTSGTRLVGFIVKFDNVGIVFFGGPRGETGKDQLLFRTSITSIVPL
jgi:RNA chaperone Hfq